MSQRDVPIEASILCFRFVFSIRNAKMEEEIKNALLDSQRLIYTENNLLVHSSTGLSTLNSTACFCCNYIRLPTLVARCSSGIPPECRDAHGLGIYSPTQAAHAAGSFFYASKFLIRFVRRRRLLALYRPFTSSKRLRDGTLNWSLVLICQGSLWCCVWRTRIVRLRNNRNRY